MIVNQFVDAPQPDLPKLLAVKMGVHIDNGSFIDDSRYDSRQIIQSQNVRLSFHGQYSPTKIPLNKGREAEGFWGLSREPARPDANKTTPNA